MYRCTSRTAGLGLALALAVVPSVAWAAAELLSVAGIPVDFILFALTLLGVALFHHRTLEVALAGLVVISLYKIGFTGFKTGPGVAGWLSHVGHEAVILLNLLGLLLGFALLSRHFEDSHVPAVLPRYLPDDWKGGFVLLAMIWILSSFLDNIAAALIGGTIARTVFRGKLHIGYLAAIVAASNAGGAWSVVGDTTTTMMWIDGVSPLQVAEASLPSAIALAIFGIPAALQQHRVSPITADPAAGIRIDWARVFIVAVILVSAIAVNVTVNTSFNEISDRFPFIGAAVWLALLACVRLRRPAWGELPAAFKGTAFLLSLVLCASMMPVERLPDATWQVAMGLGFVSAVFDNIPLTALALRQGGYDWSFLAYAVGFGGSMIWFGSSAGVALSNMYPESKSVGRWLRYGWHVALAYVVSYLAMVAILGWQPQPKARDIKAQAPATSVISVRAASAPGVEPAALRAPLAGEAVLR